ncbi:hypothetical protein NDU88_008804 [Pleurodeles waltl]|uniref:Uncharacterized protein n=1 Tax=Pleurodeles waltl TaxID=8319 RepID=A0AAV7QVT6_PLEWA|nr:hypothetical protein NDU88_008804 [Pleurodeles waltl]
MRIKFLRAITGQQLTSGYISKRFQEVHVGVKSALANEMDSQVFILCDLRKAHPVKKLLTKAFDFLSKDNYFGFCVVYFKADLANVEVQELIAVGRFWFGSTTPHTPKILHRPHSYNKVHRKSLRPQDMHVVIHTPQNTNPYDHESIHDHDLERKRPA